MVRFVLKNGLVEDLPPGIVFDPWPGKGHFALVNRAIACLDEHVLRLFIVDDL